MDGEKVPPLPYEELFEPPRIPRYTWGTIIGDGIQQEGDLISTKDNVIVDPKIIGGDITGTQNVTYTFFAYSVAVGTQKGIPLTIVVDRNCTIREIYIQAETAPGSGFLVIDVNKNGFSIFGDPLNQPYLEDTQTVAASGSPSTTNLSKNDLLTMDIDQADGTPSKLSVYVRCIV